VISSVEVSGQTFRSRADATWARSGTVTTLTETAHSRAVGQAVHLEFGGSPAPATGVHVITAVPSADTYRVTTASGSGSGPVIVRAVLGGAAGFTASGPGTLATHLAADIIMPRGLFGGGGSSALEDRTVGLTFEARRIDDAGAPLGPWITLGLPTFTDRTTTPQRRSLRWALGVPGRYAVRAWRRDAEDSAAGAGHEAGWAGLRAYLREAQDWGPVTLIALRMKATNNLSLQAGRRISVIATRKLPVWSGTSWSAPVATRSIAWALADAARDPDYGAGLPDHRIDLAALLALDALWAARGDRFDARFDQAATWWEAIGRIAAAGRARPYMQGGRLRVVRDGLQTVPVALFSMRNIVRGSFAIDYLLPTAQSSRVADVVHFDGSTWSQRRVRVSLPGEASTRPAKIELFGVTDRAQAAREGLYHLAASRYRRRLVRFATEMEGFIPAPGRPGRDEPRHARLGRAGRGGGLGRRRAPPAPVRADGLRGGGPLRRPAPPRRQPLGPLGRQPRRRSGRGGAGGPARLHSRVRVAPRAHACGVRHRRRLARAGAGGCDPPAVGAPGRDRGGDRGPRGACRRHRRGAAADRAGQPARAGDGARGARPDGPQDAGRHAADPAGLARRAGRRDLPCRDGRGHRPRRARGQLDADRRHLVQLLRRADPLSRADDDPGARGGAGRGALGGRDDRHADPRHVEHGRHADVDL
jgi:hypothetical protein